MESFYKRMAEDTEEEVRRQIVKYKTKIGKINEIDVEEITKMVDDGIDPDSAIRAYFAPRFESLKRKDDDDGKELFTELENEDDNDSNEDTGETAEPEEEPKDSNDEGTDDEDSGEGEEKDSETESEDEEDVAEEPEEEPEPEQEEPEEEPVIETEPEEDRQEDEIDIDVENDILNTEDEVAHSPLTQSRGEDEVSYDLGEGPDTAEDYIEDLLNTTNESPFADKTSEPEEGKMEADIDQYLNELESDLNLVDDSDIEDSKESLGLDSVQEAVGKLKKYRPCFHEIKKSRKSKIKKRSY